MDHKESYITRNIEETREAMSEKIEQLENRIYKSIEAPKLIIDAMIGNIDQLNSTIEETKLAINSGLDTINQAAEETIIRLKSTVNHIVQVEQNPWIMFGSAILMGYAIGSLWRRNVFAGRHTYTQVGEHHP
jgi:hypothetical protein